MDDFEPLGGNNRRDGKAGCEQADGRQGGSWHRWLKRMKVRSERRKARRNPECIPSYNKFRGYET